MSIKFILFVQIVQLLSKFDCLPLTRSNNELCSSIKSIDPSSISLDNDLCETTTWTENGTIVAGGNSSGSALNQLYSPRSFFIDTDQSFYIADTENNRVVRWIPGASQGEIVAGNNTAGSGNDQLDDVQSVVVKKDGTMFICDGYRNSRVMRWYKDAKQGQTIIENIECQLLALDNQESLYIMTRFSVIKWNGNETIISNDSAKFGGIFIDKNQSIYLSDQYNKYVLKYPMGVKEPIIVAENVTAGNGTSQLSDPLSVFVDQMENIYVLDYGNTGNARIVRWLNGSSSGSVIIDKIYSPLDFSIGLHGNLYLLESWDIRMFTIDKNTCIQG